MTQDGGKKIALQQCIILYYAGWMIRAALASSGLVLGTGWRDQTLFVWSHSQAKKTFTKQKFKQKPLHILLVVHSTSEVMLRDSHLIERPNQRGIVKSKQQQLLSPCHRSVVTSDWG